MQVISTSPQVPILSLEPDPATGSKHFRLYNFEGSRPHEADFLIPHRKDYYLIVFMRKGNSRQWIDMRPYIAKDQTLYFIGPNHVIVKEGVEKFWSTAIAFTKEFLALQENAGLRNLPIIQNPRHAHELLLEPDDIIFVEDMLAKINAEHISNPGEWQQRMLTAYLTLLLTYLSRLYIEQYQTHYLSADTLLIKKFQAEIDEHYKELHEVGDYASRLNISAGHLSELVKSQSGKPAIKHIHERLVLESRRLLVHTTDSLKEIAYELGFSDASYFNRFFKRETGETPAGYRVTIREMYQ